MSAVLDLFAGEANKTIAQQHVDAHPVSSALASIERVLLTGRECCSAFSGGKDSACVANLMLTAAMRVKERTGASPKVHVMNTDTTVESPVVRHIVEIEFSRMREFAAKHGIDLQLHVGRPTLSASWASRIVSGRALPSFPSSSADCSVDWKVLVGTRTIKRIRERAPSGVVLLIGTRRDESLVRALNTASRGEKAHEIWHGPDGDERLSPCLYWDSDTVWSYLAESAAGLHPSYSRFEELLQFYGHAGGGCVVLADMRAAATSKPCGARSGCWACVKSGPSDKSVETMLESAPEEYPYLVPLLRLRDWISRTQFAWDLRNYVGRTIEDGWIKIRPDQYSPAVVKKLLRWTLWAQDEANRLGAPSFVQPIGVRELIAIDFWWSARAYHPPGEALRVYFEHQRGLVEVPPVVEHAVRQTPLPEIGRLYVGAGWEDPHHPMRPEGLRNPMDELFSESCGRGVRVGRDGETFMDLEEEPEFDVDEEGAHLFLEFEAERKLAEYDKAPDRYFTDGATMYLTFGCVSLAKGQSSGVHNMLRRAQWLQRHDLHGHRTPDELRARCNELNVQQSTLF